MAASLSGVYNLQNFTDLGVLGVGMRLYTYTAGTTTHKIAYTDTAGSVSHTYTSDGIGGQYIALDARGELPAPLFLTSGPYDIALKTAAGATVWTRRAEPTQDAVDDVRSDLADAASTTLGAGMVGYSPTVAYAAGTVGNALHGDIGVRVSGVAGDAAAVQAGFDAANGTGRRVVIYGVAATINATLSQDNHSHYDVDWGACQVEYTGAAGTYLLNMTQAGRIKHSGGVFTGSGLNHLLKTTGSASALATVYPTIPSENQWARQIGFHPSVVTAFATVCDLQSFTREFWLSGYFTGNTTAVKVTGKVVNVFATTGTVLYSAVAASQALLVRGDAADATYRYAEGLFFQGVICDTVGTPVDIRDVYLLDVSGAQLKAAAGGIALDVTKGVCPLTRDIFISRALMQGKLRVGDGLASAFLFALHGSDLCFSDTADTAIVISANTKGVLIHGASFNSPTGTPRMFSVGASCTSIKLEGLTADSGTYTNAPTIDSTSLGGVEAEFAGSFTPGIAFGGSSTGITYSVQSGRYYFRGGRIEGYFQITLTSKGAQVGAATITGLPFNCRLVNGAAVVGKYSSMNTALTPVLDITINTAVINIKTGAGGSETVYADTAFSNASLINGSFSYPVS